MCVCVCVCVEGIVETLLEDDASVTVRNRKKQLAHELTNNINILNMLSAAEQQRHQHARRQLRSHSTTDTATTTDTAHTVSLSVCLFVWLSHTCTVVSSFTECSPRPAEDVALYSYCGISDIEYTSGCSRYCGMLWSWRVCVVTSCAGTSCIIEQQYQSVMLHWAPVCYHCSW